MYRYDDDKQSFDLDELQSKHLLRLWWPRILSVTNGDLPDADKAAMDEYFIRFAAPGLGCIGCGAKLTGDMIDQLLGQATFTWGLCHGEGFCSRCGYPARAYHYDIGPIKKLPLVLQYHPDELSRVEPDESDAVGQTAENPT